jgi:hypothetical protein
MKWKVCACFTWAALLLVAWSVPSAPSGEKKKDGVTEFSDKAVKAPVPVNFNAELGLSFASLADLDNRIRLGRILPDPVGLAAAAHELAVAEKVAGKQASLTAKALATEAADLAKRRYDPQELQAVAMLTGNQELQALVKEAAEEKIAAIKGEKTRGITGKLRVISRNKRLQIRIYVDGNFIGNVNPGQTRVFDIYQSQWENTRLKAMDISGDSWQKTVPFGEKTGAVYTWTLRPWQG